MHDISGSLELLRLPAFVPSLGMETAIALAARAGFDTDDGRKIMTHLAHHMKASRFVIPPVATPERIGIARRASAGGMATQKSIDSLDGTLGTSMDDLRRKDPELCQSRLTWLRRWPLSKSACGQNGILNRLEFALGHRQLPPKLGADIHPTRLSRSAREGRVAANNLNENFSERRRIASVAAQGRKLQTVPAEAAIAVFEDLASLLLARSKNRQERFWPVSNVPVRRLMAMFGDTIDALVEALERMLIPFNRCVRWWHGRSQSGLSTLASRRDS